MTSWYSLHIFSRELELKLGKGQGNRPGKVYNKKHDLSSPDNKLYFLEFQ